jgi:hypothetical protein
LLCGLPLLAAVAHAQISPIGEFTGSTSEGFESFPNYNSGNVDALSVMAGTALFRSLPFGTNQLYIYEPGAGANWGLGNNGFAGVHSGEKGLGINLAGVPCNAALYFNAETFRFGGWFGTASITTNFLTVTFFDAADVQIGASQSLSTNSGVLEWFGWQSNVGIMRVHFGGNEAPAMDDIQASPVPEPGTIAVVIVGLAALVARRRK